MEGMCCYVLGRLILLVAISEIECVRGELMAHQGEGVPIQGYLLLMGEQLESIEKMVIGIIDGYWESNRFIWLWLEGWKNGREIELQN